MAHETLAPWAEIVPDHGPMTADELLATPDDEWQYELVDGVLVKMPPPGFQHGVIVAELLATLRNHVRAHHLGVVTGADTGYLLSQVGQKDTVLAPDIAFIQSGRAPDPNAPDIHKYQRLAPDAVAEVVSPDQYRPEMAAKARLYLQAGVRLVWIVWPAAKTVDVWRPGSDTPVTLTAADVLDGYDVVPDFTYPLADLFA